jgi:peptidyl-tRNA hydrolase ICT1
MLRCRFAPRTLISVTRAAPQVQRCLSSASARDSSSASDDDLKAARSWLAGLHAEAIPLKSIGELSFSRSSGPGGQNVNKYDQLAKFQRRAVLSMPKESILKLL